LPGSSLFSEPNRKGSFSEHDCGPHGYNPAYMWRTASAKLILYPTPSSDGGDTNSQEYHGELYDLESDPGERVNLYDSPDYAGLRESMTRELLMHLCQKMRRYPCPDDRTR